MVKEGRHNGKRVDPSRLTPRERQVTQLLASGAKQTAIAAQLGVSKRTVEAHTRHIREKTNTGSVFELAFKVATGRIVIDEPDKTD